MKNRSRIKALRSYREAYGFSEDPFALNPDPKFLYLSPTHSEALFSMLSGIKDRVGIIVITGEAGVGKTILVYRLLKDRTEKTRTAFVFNPTLDLRGILENIFQELGLPIREKGENLFSLLVHFRKTLQESFKQSETVAIVIDEAQSLDEEVLEGLFRLATPDSPGTQFLQILLVGHPDLQAKLHSERFTAFKERIAIKAHIHPFTREEGRDYIGYRLNLVGRDISEVFTVEGVNRILEFARGNPRVINLLCNRALLIGRDDARPMVDVKIVTRAIKDLEYLRGRKPKTSPTLLSRHIKSWPNSIRILFFAFSAGVFLLSLAKIFSLLLQK